MSAAPRTILVALGVVVTAMAGPTRGGEPDLIQNGDFELSTLTGCADNNTNEEFTAAMGPHVVGWGPASHIDIFNEYGDACFGAPPPPSGDFMVGVHAAPFNGDYDAFSFELAESVVAGHTYELSFYVFTNWLLMAAAEAVSRSLWKEPDVAPVRFTDFTPLRRRSASLAA